VLIAGGPQTCKTALAMAHVARTMKEDPNALCLWADAENSFDPPWAKKQGIDLNRLIVIPSMIADDMVTEIERVLNEVPVSNVTVDSVGSLLSWQEVMKDRDDSHYTKEVSADTMALTARFMSKLCRRWIPWIHRNKMTMTFITHVYSVIGSYSGAEEIKGGKGLQHSVHLTIWTSRRKGDQEQKQKIKMPDGRVVDLFTAYEAVFTVQKTRQSPTEGQKVAIPFVYGKGLSETESVIEMAFAMGVIQANGSWYTHPSFAAILNGEKNNWINGYDATVKFIRENESVFDAVLKGVGAVIAADDAAPEMDDGAQQ
jgi:RecA/RadA recombinase